MRKICIFFQKYLVISKICSNFARFFVGSVWTNASIAQLVEHNLAKVGVASSSLVFRSFFFAQMAELVDACVSGAHAARCAGSSPVLGT